MRSTPEAKARLEAAGHRAALSYMGELAKNKKALDHIALRKIHRLIFERSWPEIAGKFRNQNVEIAKTSYLPPHWRQVTDRVCQALGSLNYCLKSLKEDDVKGIIKCAAQAHYNIAAIHPFWDGNGRVARIVLNYVFHYFGLPDVFICKEDRDRYLDALEAANREDLGPLIDLVAQCYERSLDQILGQDL